MDLNGFPSRLESGKIKLRNALGLGGISVCWLGDSITEQGKAGIGNGYGFTTHIQNMFTGNIYSNLGTGGETTKTLALKLSMVHPSCDLAIIAIGVNDARYNDSRGALNSQEFSENICAISSYFDSCVFISPWPSFVNDAFASGGHAATVARIELYNTTLEQCCKNNGDVYINAYETIRSVVNIDATSLLFTDGIHPNYNDYDGKNLYGESCLRNFIEAGKY